MLGSVSSGESNKFIDLFTADLGRVHGVARSVREEKSKLRFSLQDFSFVEVSLVRGKDVWRVVGAESAYNIVSELKDREEEMETVVRIISLIKRLLSGEDENRELFALLSDAIDFLRSTILTKEGLSNFECLVVLRILYNLGYLAKDNTNAPFLENADLDTNLVSHITPLRFDMIKSINTSLQESQL